MYLISRGFPDGRFLVGWNDAEAEGVGSVLAGGLAARALHGLELGGGARVAIGGDRLDWAEDRLHGGDAARPAAASGALLWPTVRFEPRGAGAGADQGTGAGASLTPAGGKDPA